jgi:colanic acid biosynthesis protein WcaH
MGVWATIEILLRTMSSHSLLPAAEFAQACAALPLVSVEWVLTNPDRQLLLGQRINAPARGWWFTPGGRIRKNEAFAQAKLRIAQHELGLRAELLDSAVLLGVWDHFYPDSAFSSTVSTHYVNLPHWLQLSWQDVSQLRLQPDEQHAAWQWLDLARAASDEAVHPYVRAYAQQIHRSTEMQDA